MPTKNATTPISTSKAAALSRVQTVLAQGYTRWTTGKIKPEKAIKVIQKLHDLHHIGAGPAERITRKSKGKANAVLSVYWPDEAEVVEYCLLFSPGSLDSPEPQLRDTTEKRQKLEWLGYEATRHTNHHKARPTWTWRRPNQTMEDRYAVVNSHLGTRNYNAVRELFDMLTKQPGFHGIRKQTIGLFQHAKQKGYPHDLPTVYFLPKISHGKPFPLTNQPRKTR